MGATRVVRADVIVSQVDTQQRTVHVIAQDGEVSRIVMMIGVWRGIHL